MNWWFISIIILSGIGLLTMLFDKKAKISKRLAGIIGYLVYMGLIALAIKSGW